VIEGSITPSAWGMTRTTVRAELSVMGILAGMAGITICWRTFINTIRVTGTALNIRVFARKREGCVVVIEGYVAPATGVVT